MKEKTCFLIGNRYAPNNIKEKLSKIIEKHINEYDVTTFIVGHYGDFDKIVGSTLKETKKVYSNIKLYLLEPYALTRKIQTPYEFDGTLYPDGLERVPLKFAIVQANKYVVANSNYLIAYCHVNGNTRSIVEYAQKLQKRGLIKITLL